MTLLNPLPSPPEAAATTSILVLGGGCFWCTQAVYVQVKGVTALECGYSNGNPRVVPNYERVCGGNTDYNEVVRIAYDATQVSVRELLEVFFVIHDPTTPNRQGHDVGTQYRSGIYFTEAVQQAVASDLIAELNASGVYRTPVVTELVPLADYFTAEDYHQDFFARNPNQGYCMAVAAPKVAKFRQTFARLQKA